MTHRGLSRTLLIIFLSLSLVSCSVRRVNFNEPISDERLQFIQAGQTTLQQVVNHLGAPEEMIITPDTVIAEFKWATTRSSSLDLGYLFRLVSPVSPSMTLSGTGINIESLHLTCDQHLVVRSYAFGKSDEHAFFEFWPF